MTCLDYHYETQPLPNPVSWYAHYLPKPFHRLAVIGNYVAQLPAPLLLFAPQPIASLAAALMIATQLWLVLTGNYSWLNYITIALGLSAVDDRTLMSVFHLDLPRAANIPLPFEASHVILALIFVVLSIPPVLNMLSPNQVMNYNYNPLHLVNTY